MHGNALEWCADDFDFYAGHPTRTSREERNKMFRTPGTPSPTKSVRGGCYSSIVPASRCQERSGWSPQTRDERIGFRLARDIGSSSTSSSDFAKERDDHIAEGKRLLGEDKLTEALAEFSKAVDADPNSATALSAVGYTYLQMGKAKEAVEPLKTATTSEGVNWRVYTYLGMAYRELGSYPEATANLRQAVDLNPTLAAVVTELGITYFAAGDYKNALQSFTRAEQLEPNEPGHRLNVARAMLKLRQFAEARLYLMSVLAKQPNNAEAHYGLALAYAGLGNEAKMREHADTVKRIAPKLSDALAKAIGEQQPPLKVDDFDSRPQQSSFTLDDLLVRLKELERSLIVEQGSDVRRSLLEKSRDELLGTAVTVSAATVDGISRRQMQMLQTFSDGFEQGALGHFEFYFDEGEGGGIYHVHTSMKDWQKRLALLKADGFDPDFDNSAKCVLLSSTMNGRRIYFQLFTSDEYYAGSRKWVPPMFKEKYANLDEEHAYPPVRTVQSGDSVTAQFELWGVGINCYDPTVYAGVQPGSLVKQHRQKHVDDPGPIIIVGLLKQVSK